MWIDTHCHLDASEFDADRDEVAASARRRGRHAYRDSGRRARELRDGARRLRIASTGGAYALGIHPLFTPRADGRRSARACARKSKRVSTIRASSASARSGSIISCRRLDDARQQFFYNEQLKLAREFDLPVICHVRKSQDKVLKGLRVHRREYRHRACVQWQFPAGRGVHRAGHASRLRRQSHVRARAADSSARGATAARCDRRSKPMRPISRLRGVTSSAMRRIRSRASPGCWRTARHRRRGAFHRHNG